MGRLRNIYLVVSQGCNLSCGYCYAKGGDFGRGKLLMDSETMKKAMERLLPLTEGRGVISFFGGEPLLNQGLMEETIAFGKGLKEKGIDLSFSITTNGTLITDENIPLLREIPHIAVSLDGNSLVNDSQRRFRNSSASTHHAVTEGIKKLRDAAIPFGIRGTVTEEAAACLEDTATYLHRLGPQSLRLSPVMGRDWEPHSLRLLSDGFSNLYLSSLERIFQGEEPVIAEHLYKLLLHLFLGEKRVSPCVAGEGIVAVAADGDVYPCDHFIGAEEFFMGNVHDRDFPGEAYFQVQERLKGNTVDSRRWCSVCEIRHICGGECHAASLVSCGDIQTSSAGHCAMMRGIMDSLMPEVKRAIGDETKKARIRRFLGV